MTTPSQRHQLFISYSHKDANWVERLRTILKPLERMYGLERWDDSRIQAGMIWREEIEKALASAQVALLLVSGDFLASDFVTRSELPPLFHAAKQEGLRILWVPLRPCLWEEIPEIEQYQAVIPPGRTVAEMAEVEQDQAFVQIAKEIKKAFQEEAQRRERQNEEREQQERDRQEAEHQRKLQRYERDFSQAIDAQYPLDNLVVDRFKELQRELKLSNEDIAKIEQPLLAPKQAEDHRKQAEEQERQRQQVERLAKEKEENERKAQEERQRKVAEERRTRQRQETERLAREKESRGFSRQLLSGCEVGLILQDGTDSFGAPKWRVVRRPLQVEGYREELAEGVALSMVKIPAGSFLMGSPKHEPERRENEGPQHEVTLGAFFLAQTPITQAQWRVVADWEKVERELNPDPSDFKGPNRPVDNVTWNDATEFCRRLSQRSGKCYGLPREAQWEYACRAGTTTPFHFGETLTPELANYDALLSYSKGPEGGTWPKQTTDVGSFPANAWGLQDMHGNVWE